MELAVRPASPGAPSWSGEAVRTRPRPGSSWGRPGAHQTVARGRKSQSCGGEGGPAAPQPRAGPGAGDLSKPHGDVRVWASDTERAASRRGRHRVTVPRARTPAILLGRTDETAPPRGRRAPAQNAVPLPPLSWAASAPDPPAALGHLAALPQHCRLPPANPPSQPVTDVFLSS